MLSNPASLATLDLALFSVRHGDEKSFMPEPGLLLRRILTATMLRANQCEYTTTTGAVRLEAVFGAHDLTVRKVSIQVVQRHRSERPHWQMFDFCSIIRNATDVEVCRSLS